MTRLMQLGFVLASMALAGLAAADVRSTPDERAGVLLLALLVAWAAGSLVVGSRRRRT